MKSKPTLVLMIIFGFALAFALRPRDSGEPKSASGEDPIAQKIPPLPAGVTELKFSEFFVSPVGPRGLELTDRLLSLDGKRVRMLGYMVRNERGLPGKFLFAAMPVQLHDHDSSDDLPAALVHVSVPTCRGEQVPHAPGLMLLTGTLNLGNREEGDGRMSLVRLALDPPQAESGHRLVQKNIGPDHSSSTDSLSAQFHQH